MLSTRLKLRAILLTIAVVAVIGTWGSWIDFRDGDPDDRAATITVTWQPAADRAPGYINIKGKLAGPIEAEAYSPSPFVETEAVRRGDLVEVHASAIDGPFLSFDCSIVVAGPDGAEIRQNVTKTIWAGLRAVCRAVIA